MIDADEDEDVVFEGSAIDQHLQNIGYSDYEATQMLHTHQQKAPPSKKGRYKVDLTLLKRRLQGLTTCIIWPKELEKNFYMKVIRDINESKLLISDDNLLLKHFIPDDYFPSKKLAGCSVITDIFLWCLWRIVLLSSFCFGAIFLFLENTTDRAFIFLPIIFTVLVWIVTVSFLVYRSSLDVHSFVSGLRCTIRLSSKAMRFLLEEDLVSRGFFLAQGSSSFTSRDRREAPYCEGLRHSLHNTLYTMLPVLHHSHKYFEKIVSYYPCMRGLFDDFEEMNLEMRQDPVEHLKFLKKLVTLIKLQTSAVLTEFILCIVDEEALKCLLQKNFVNSELMNQVMKASNLLGKHFEYAQSFWQKDIDGPEINCEDKKNNVYVAIHSLSLHMQAALHKIQEMEKKFELSESNIFCQDVDGKSTEKLPSYEQVKEQLELIQIELQSCQGCLDETTARVGRKYEIKEEKIDELPLNRIEDITSTAPAKKDPIPLFELGDPIIQDEVFEAYIDEGYDYREDSDDDFWNTDARQERKKLKQQKEQGKRVLHELQPLLNKLRETWEEREIAALQRQKGGVAQAGSVEDSPIYKETRAKEEEEDIEFTTVPLMQVKTDQTVDISGDSRNGDSNIDAIDNEKLLLSLDCESQKLCSSKFDTFGKVKKGSKNFEGMKCDEKLDDDIGDEGIQIYKQINRQQELDEKYDALQVGGQKININNVDGKHNFADVSGTKFVSVDSGSECDELSDKGLQLKEEFQTCLQNLASESTKVSSDLNSALAALRTENHIGDVVSVDSKRDDKLSSEPKDETFGDDSHDDDDEDSRDIDWNAFNLPARMTDTLEDRMQLYSGQRMGFHSEIAAQVQAASQQFLLNKGSVDETFLGVGENEEVFGDSESESD